ncbi:MAG: hypothetical protein ACFE8E_04480 [Candidatus Hodarchaeota archaeon]
MNKSKKIRQANNFEIDIIINSLSQISPKFKLSESQFDIYIFLNDKSKNRQLSVYITRRKFIDLGKLMNFTNIHSLGLYFGFIRKGIFFLSLEGADYLYKSDYISKTNYLIVNEEGEKALLYGNHVIKKMITFFSMELTTNSVVVILNKSKELLALGIIKVEGNRINSSKPEEVIAINLVDKGYYLRKERIILT